MNNTKREDFVNIRAMNLSKRNKTLRHGSIKNIFTTLKDLGYKRVALIHTDDTIPSNDEVLTAYIKFDSKTQRIDASALKFCYDKNAYESYLRICDLLSA